MSHDGSGFRFGAYWLDVRGRRLFRGDVLGPLQSRQFDLLHALVKRPGDLVTKDELIADAWRGRAVSDAWAVPLATLRTRACVWLVE